MTVKEFFSWKTNGFFWKNVLGMILLFVVLLLGVLKGLDVYTRHGEAVEVPDVKGLSADEAARTLRARGLEAVVADSVYVKGESANVVLDLKPQSGHKVKEGRTVYLTINTLNVPLRLVPDVADNSSMRQAQAKLTAAGFKLSTIELINGEQDWVYGVKYRGRELASGEKIPQGATLTLVVGNGQGAVQAADSLTTDDENPDGTQGQTTTQEDGWF